MILPSGFTARAPAKRTTSITRFRMVTALGDMVIEVYPDRAPHSADAFCRQVAAGAYCGASFTRIVRSGNDRGTPPIEVIQAWQRDWAGDEPHIVHESTNRTGLTHEDGTLSLPRRDGGTGSARTFFICIGTQPALDANGGRMSDGLGFAAFGRVIEGMEVARAIHQITTIEEAENDYLRGQLAAEPVMIERVTPEVPDTDSDHSRPLDMVDGPQQATQK